LSEAAQGWIDEPWENKAAGSDADVEDVDEEKGSEEKAVGEDEVGVALSMGMSALQWEHLTRGHGLKRL
jgi:hypothetical protein